MKILIVDDSLAMRRLIQRAIRQAGFGDHEILEAANGRAGLEAAQAEAPDVIVSDWKMPEMNGLEFLAALRQVGNETPFGFVANEAVPDMQEQARAAGADFMIAKPLSPAGMEASLTPYLG